MDICILPPHVVNKIAAGEVIERPASILKELTENAIDAGATRIEIHVEQGGGQLIRVVDNGRGMSAAQLPLAVTSHATSKIRSDDDLFSVTTLGFRGEALASIGAVSQLTLRSCPREESTAGAQLTVHGGEMSPVTPCSCPVGTTVEVRNLFFNTPVRRKFMRTAQTELAHLAEAFIRLALPHSNIHFLLKHNDRLMHELPTGQDWRQRIATFFGDELAEALIWVQGDDGPVQLQGYVANPTQTRSHNRLQYLFLNNRHIRDRSLQHALSESYRGLIMTGRFPIAFLRLDMPPELVDVNVHPTKLEVRFQDSGRLYSQLLGTIRNRFLTSDLTAHVGSKTGNDGAVPAQVPTWPGANGAPAGAGTGAPDLRSEFWGSGQEVSIESQGAIRSDPVARPDSAAGREAMGGVPPWGGDSARGPRVGEPLAGAATRPPHFPGSTWGPTPHRDHGFGGAPRALQIHNRYLVTENHEGVVIIDQHALHERILYEQLREKMASGNVEKQRLLVPEPVDLTPQEVAILLEHESTLSHLGIEITSLGGDTILLSAYPALLKRFDGGELLRQLADSLRLGKQQFDGRDVCNHLLSTIACKAAVKAGDRLSTDEVVSLLEHRHLVHDAHHCPHGRPSALVFTREELDRRFGRT